MSEDVYRELAKHLDTLPGGFPPTASGVELRILRRLFTPEEAAFAVHLTLKPEQAETIARRAGVDTEPGARRLAVMARRGLIFSLEPPDRPPRYMAAQFVVGIWEYHVNDLDADLIRDVNEYLPHLTDLPVWKEAPQLRTVPVGSSFDVDHHVLAHEQAEELVRSRTKIAVAPCICRREQKILGQGCAKMEEACLIFDAAADYYLRNGLGRQISADAALEILRRADEAGLVLQPSNARNPANICCCCGCCCQILKNVARRPRPAEYVSSAFTVALTDDACAGCGSCVDRCQMAALQLEGAQILLDTDRCIGCGLCVSSCPTGTLQLVRKPDEEQPHVPASMSDGIRERMQLRQKMRALERSQQESE